MIVDINIATTGTHALIPAVDSQAIKVYRAFLVADGNVTITLQEKKNGVAKIHFGPLRMAAGIPHFMPCLETLISIVPLRQSSCDPYITTNPGASLEMITSGNQQVSGQIGFYYT